MIIPGTLLVRNDADDSSPRIFLARFTYTDALANWVRTCEILMQDGFIDYGNWRGRNLVAPVESSAAKQPTAEHLEVSRSHGPFSHVVPLAVWRDRLVFNT